ncbi:NifU family protein, partial [Streptomyces sp. MBT54]|nr:NifU family protein [Streptomyces sp. MBT54]
LRLRLRGSCDGCPSSTQTVRWTIEDGQPSQLPRNRRRSVGPSAASVSSPATSTSPAWEPR